MGKAKVIAITMGVVIVWYVILMAFQPALNDLTVMANTTLAAEPNISSYWGVLATVNYWPLVAWFVPGVVGMIIVVWTLRQN